MVGMVNDAERTVAIDAGGDHRFAAGRACGGCHVRRLPGHDGYLCDRRLANAAFMAGRTGSVCLDALVAAGTSADPGHGRDHVHVHPRYDRGATVLAGVIRTLRSRGHDWPGADVPGGSDD